MERTYRSPEPFELPGLGAKKSTGILMIHGFTGSPSEFRRLGLFLNEEGYTVNAVLLPGHGTTPEQMIMTTWRDWWEHVEHSCERMKERGCERIIAIGFSMGGLLALKLAAEKKVSGVVSLSAPMFLQNRKTVFAALLQYFVRYVGAAPVKPEPRFEEVWTYAKIPVPCVVSLRKLMKRVKGLLHRVDCPIFIAQGEKDGTVQPRSAAYLFERVSSERKRLEYYPNSSHAILVDQDRERLYEDIARFIGSIS